MKGPTAFDMIALLLEVMEIEPHGGEVAIEEGDHFLVAVSAPKAVEGIDEEDIGCIEVVGLLVGKEAIILAQLFKTVHRPGNDEG